LGEAKRTYKWFFKACPTCQKNNQHKSMAIARPFTLSSANPMQKIYLDLIEDLREDEDGNKHIAFSRYLSLYPMRNKTADAVAKAFLTMIGDLHHKKSTHYNTAVYRKKRECGGA
jgi:hypothetical protein